MGPQYQVTAAHVAAGRSAEVLRMLLQGGAALEARDANKWGLVHHAAWHGNVGAIKLLVERGARLNMKDR